MWFVQNMISDTLYEEDGYFYKSAGSRCDTEVSPHPQLVGLKQGLSSLSIFTILLTIFNFYS